MAARDLVAELKNKRAAVTSAAVAEPKASGPVLQASSKVKAVKTEPAAEEPMNTAQIEEMAAAVAHRELDACWFLNVSEEVQDAAVESGDLKDVECLQALTGTAFSDTGIEFNGQPLYKSTEDQLPLACALYFFAVPNGSPTVGWYCATHLFRSEKEKNRWDSAGGLRVLCWAGGQHNVPTSFHFPYWAKKPTKGIESTSVWESYLTLAQQTIYCREKLDESMAEMCTLREELKHTKEQLQHLAACMDKVVNDENMTEDDKADAKSIVEATTVVGEEEGADHQDEEEEVDEQKGKGHGKSSSSSKGKQQPKKHGGWMPRLAQLASAYMRADWSYCSKLIARFRGESKTFAQVLDQKNAGHLVWNESDWNEL